MPFGLMVTGRKRPGGRSRRDLGGFVAWGLLAFCLSVGWERPAAAETLQESSTSAEDKADAIRSIPFDQLTDETRAKLMPIISRPDLYRRLPVVAIESDPDFYLHLIRHPEVVVNIWHLMGITQINTRRVGEFQVDASDGAGTQSRIELVYGTPTLHVMYAEGVYEGSLLRNRITGRCVMVLHSDYRAGESGRTQVNNRLDVFMVVDQRSVGLVAKGLQGMVGKAADHNFIETANFLGRLSRSAEENGIGVQQMANEMEDVSPEIRREFAELAMLTHRRAQHRLESQLPRRAGSATIPSTVRASGIMESP